MRLLVGTLAGAQSVFAVQGDMAVNLTDAVPDIGTDLAALTAAPDLMARAMTTAAPLFGVARSNTVCSLWPSKVYNACRLLSW